jgi:hypothetical protein
MFEVWGRRHWDYLTHGNGRRALVSNHRIGVQALAHWLARRSPDFPAPISVNLQLKLIQHRWRVLMIAEYRCIHNDERPVKQRNVAAKYLFMEVRHSKC